MMWHTTNPASSLMTAFAMAGLLAMGSNALGQHGIGISQTCQSPVAVGQLIDCDISVLHTDSFGDSLQIDGAFAIVDGVTQVPSEGNLEIIGVIGNTTAVVGGTFPFLIGPAGSELSGLPGIPQAGEVIFGNLPYIVQPDDPAILTVQSNVSLHDLCDAPGSVGCSMLPSLVQFGTDITVVTESGSCCSSLGCTIETESDCLNLEGSYNGDGTTCEPFPCEVKCCLPDASCAPLTIDECVAQDGLPGSAGSSCFSDGSVCPSVAACCLPEGTCQDIIEFSCGVLGGEFLGDGTACATSLCLGACCFEPSGNCSDFTAAACGDAGGTFFSGTNCAVFSCSGTLGACCFGDACEESTQAQCEQMLGTYIGFETLCADDPCPRRCCLPDGTCIETDTADCVSQDGMAGPLSSTCPEGSCPPPGACCFEGDCQELADFACAAVGGLFQGAGTPCSPNPCEGACCYTNGTCTVVGAFTCSKTGGLFEGAGTSCDTKPCVSFGACCYTNGTCTVVDSFACSKTGGLFEGNGTSCDTKPCPPRGACCLLDGTCTFTFAGECAASLGVYRGAGIPCAVYACPDPGAVLSQEKIADGTGGFTGFLNFDARFGRDIAGLGDLNQDGVRDAIVGAPTSASVDGSVFIEGSAWVLLLEAGGTVASEISIGDHPAFGGDLLPDDRLGASVTTLGDLDGDGVVDVALGAPGDDDNDDGLSGNTEHGAVWIAFLNNDGSVKAVQKISEAEGGLSGGLSSFDRFGTSVAGLGDLDGDGTPDLAAGAPGTDDEIDEGAVWVLLLNADGTVKAQTSFGATGGFVGLSFEDGLGQSITSLGDLDDDGKIDVAIGAIGDDEGGPSRGAVWIVSLNADGTVADQTKIADGVGGFSGALDNFDAFGAAVAALGDLDGDGVVDLAAGAPGDDDSDIPGNGGQPDRGAVWILLLFPDGSVKSQRKISDTVSEFAGALNDGDGFGGGLGAIGDLDGNGVTELMVGAPFDDTGGNDHGAVWTLFLDGDASIQFSNPTEFVAAGDLNVAAVADLDTAILPDPLAPPAPFDLDADGPAVPAGAPDVAVLLPDDGLVQIFRNAGTDGMDDWLGFIDPALTFDAGPTPTAIAVGDFNGNGYHDLAIANGAANTVTVLFNAADDTGSFPFDVTVTGFANASAIAAANFVGDSAIDLAVANEDASTVVFLENDGTGSFTPIANGLGGVGVATNPLALDPVDIDNDKDADLLAVGGDPGGPSAALSVIVNDDDDTFTVLPDIPLPPGPTAIGSEDVDGNGFKDPVSSNRGDGSASVVLNQGNTADGATPSFAPPLNLLVGADPRSVDVADFDGDGDVDIAVTAVDMLEGPSVVVLENLLDETDTVEFKPPVAVNVIGEPVFVVNGDMDGNGLTDIVTANDDEDVPDDGSVTVVLGVPEVFCDSDFDGNGQTDFGDVFTLIVNWGRCTAGAVCPGDINADSVIDFQDLLLLLASFGPCE